MGEIHRNCLRLPPAALVPTCGSGSVMILECQGVKVSNTPWSTNHRVVTMANDSPITLPVKGCVVDKSVNRYCSINLHQTYAMSSLVFLWQPGIRAKGLFRAWWGHNSSYCFLYNMESLVSLIQKIYNLSLTHLTPVSRSLPSPPLISTPPLRFPTFLKLILKNGLVGLSKSWIRSPLFCMSVLRAPWNISLKVRQR